jgi:hypothetical protein
VSRARALAVLGLALGVVAPAVPSQAQQPERAAEQEPRAERRVVDESPEEQAGRARWQALARDEREAIKQVVGPLPSERRRALRDRLTALPPELRRAATGRLARVLAMEDGERADLRERLRHLEGLTAEQRKRLRANLERWRAMSPAERDAARARWRRYQELPERERQQLERGDS